jgi:hypothetical protein
MPEIPRIPSSTDPLQALELAQSKSTIPLDLVLRPDDGKAIRNLSGAAAVGEKLFLVGDEGTSIMRLRRDSVGYHREKTFDVTRLFDHVFADSDGKTGECDFEAVSLAGDRLWVIGSHTCGHGKLDPGKPDKMLRNLQRIQRPANRLMFGWLPVGADGAGKPPAKSGRHMKITPESNAARCKTHATNRLLTALTKGPNTWLAPYTRLPTKENGLDIEGLAVAGDRAWIGLRGPVVGEHAVIVDLRLQTKGRHVVPVPGSLCFHFLDLGGLGIRDLLLDGPNHLLVLAGMTMHRQGLAGLFRWNHAVSSSKTDLVFAAALTPLLRFDAGPIGDGPEAICFLPPPDGSVRDSDPRELLLVRDNPHPQRITGSTYHAEVYTI